MNSINLYNHWHYGDIFLSRMIVRSLSEHFNIVFHHNLKDGLFDDMTNIKESIGIPKNYLIQSTDLSNFIVNTWIGQRNMFYLKSNFLEGCSFNNYIKLIKDVLNYYDIPLRDPDFYLPRINYEKLKNFSDIKNNFINLTNKFDKTVLISNGDVLSKQSYNFDFSPIIYYLSLKYPNYLFLTTKKNEINNHNIYYTSDLTNKIPDLLYISFFSTMSEVCIGRASGPYTFFMTYDNIMNSNKTIISFNNKKPEGYFYDDIKFNFIWSNDYSSENIIKTINSAL